ncbi:hypothetical protein D3H55_08850 [Bacillus salacetis]|uniref:Uncharacterized protein n=1 Tax=Bacillus salacetis TaxID=2315464 RepID=A0A3A1R303_9BACI|nr:hypothetical protein [Bacillus salacetis]RIW34614.1 hypothetical protein D3H55_08850 [Bacillus salacetis]
MNLNQEDQSIIEKALKSASANTTDHHAVFQFQNVLQKLQQNHEANTAVPQQDGFRYDYDDSKEV